MATFPLTIAQPRSDAWYRCEESAWRQADGPTYPEKAPRDLGVLVKARFTAVTERMLRWFADGGEAGRSLLAYMQKTGLAYTTVRRMARTLERRGDLERVPSTERKFVFRAKMRGDDGDE